MPITLKPKERDAMFAQITADFTAFGDLEQAISRGDEEQCYLLGRKLGDGLPVAIEPAGPTSAGSSRGRSADGGRESRQGEAVLHQVGGLLGFANGSNRGRYSAVSVVDAHQASGAVGAAADLRELWQAVGEIAEGRTACHRDETEGGYCDACAGVEAVEQQDQHDHS
jgi:hypothetical protein